MIGKRTMVRRVFLWVLTVLFCLSTPALAEATERGNLSERFDDIVAMEYNGVTYRIRNRITVALVMGTVGGSSDETGTDFAEMMYLLVIDDDQKIYTPIRISSDALVDWGGSGLSPETGEVQLRALYSMGADENVGCGLIVQKLNEILGDELIGSYAALDLDRLTVLDGIEPGEEYVEEEYKERLRAIKAKAESSSTDEVNAMFNALSGYIVTDMKSGALMKIVDKVDRYDGQPTIPLPVVEEVMDDGQVRVTIDAEAVLPAVLDAFYEEYTAW